MIIHTHAYPRAALIGNPSDGYYGKTISFTFSNFQAEVDLYQTPELEIVPNQSDHSQFFSITDLVNDVNLYGYYGGIRLIKATIKKFHDYCHEKQIELDDRNFTIRYRSSIPNRLGLAGSTAIIGACMKALMAFYSIDIPKPILANLLLSVEVDELSISAGLQDRVAVVYGGLVYMDFNRELIELQGYGRYEYLDRESLPPLYIAYRTDLSQGSEVVHNNFRSRYESGDSQVLDAIQQWISITDEVRDLLDKNQGSRIGDLLDRNFDVRDSVFNISSGNQKMVELARSTGASAKFTGSGGAIIGTYEDEHMFHRLKQTLGEFKIEVIKPQIGERQEDTSW